MTTFVTSRTHAQDYLNCKRYRYWRTLYRQTGIEPVRSSIPLVVGSSVHVAIEHILHGVINEWGDVGHGYDTKDEWIEGAVKCGLKYYDDECARRELDIAQDEELPFVMQEQRAMIEAIVRGWIAFILPQLLEEYHVVGIEREDVFKLADIVHDKKRYRLAKGYSMGDQKLGEQGIADTLWWQSRADIDLQSKRTGELYVASIKNLRAWDDLHAKNSELDQQGFSELYAAEQARGVNYAGVQMLISIKGSRRKGWNSEEGTTDGPKLQDSFLVRPWMKQGITSDGDSFAWKSSYTCTEPHKMGNGRKCDGGKNHRLGKEWSRVFIWEVMSVAEWIKLLASGTVQGDGNPFDEVFKMPHPHARNREHIEEWLESTRETEVQVAQDGEYVNSFEEGSKEWKLALWQRFGKNTTMCYKYGESYGCDMIPICFQGVEFPLESGAYAVRRPHHSLERELFKERGVIFEV